MRFLNLADEMAIQVVSVSPDGSGSHARIEPGDLLIAIGDRKLTTVDDLHRFLTEWPVGNPVKLTIVSGKEKMQVEVVPVEAEEE